MDRDPLMDWWASLPTGDFQPTHQRKNTVQLKDIVHKSRFNLNAGLAWTGVSSLAYLLLAIFIEEHLIRAGLFGMVVMNIIIARPIPMLLRQIRRINISDPILPHIRQIVEAMEAWWRFQQRIVWLFFPAATLFGGFVGAWMEAGDEAYRLFRNPGFLGFFLPLVALLSWLSYKATQWMQKMSYGKDIRAWEAFLEQPSSDTPEQ